MMAEQGKQAPEAEPGAAASVHLVWLDGWLIFQDRVPLWSPSYQETSNVVQAGLQIT